MKIFLSLLLLFPFAVFAQYTGGSSDGYSSKIVGTSLDPGIISESQVIEPDEDPDPIISASDAGGFKSISYSWEWSADGTNYAPLGITTPDYDISGIDFKGYYIVAMGGDGYELFTRRKATPDSGTEMYSNVVSVKVLSYTYDNTTGDDNVLNPENWDKMPYGTHDELPGVGKSIKFGVTASVPAIGTLSYANMTVETGAEVTVDTGTTFAISHDIANRGTINLNGAITVDGGLSNSGALTIKSDVAGTGSLITNGSTLSDGNYTVERYLDENETWQLFSSPSTNETSNVLLGHFLNEFDESLGDFNPIRSTSYSLTPGDGYVAKLDFGLASNATNPIVFTTDKPNTGNVTPIALNVTPEELKDPDINGSTYSNTYFDLPVGFNLVGNPYPSRINWNMLYNRNSGAIDNAYYRYRDAGNGNGVWHAYLANDATTADKDSIINIGQGFGVILTGNAVANTLTFYDAVRTHNNGLGFGKKSTVIPQNFNLVATSNGMSDDVSFRINEISTSNYDGHFDAYKINSFGDTPTPSFISADGKKLAICQQPESESVDLGFNMATSGEVTFSVSSVSDFTELVLEDKQEGVFTDLIKSTYTFNYSDEDAETGRFTIHFNKETLNEEEELTGIKIYSNSSDITLNSEKALNNVEIELYDFSGQKILSKHFESLKQQEINTSLNGVYILKLTSDNGVYSSKLILN